eukprot:2295418-Rhodomonas_salina.2
MGMEVLNGSRAMVQVTASIRLDLALWIWIAKNDQTMVYFKLCQIICIPFREAVWQYCKCLTACHTMQGFPQVSFTTVEFSLTGLEPRGKQLQHPAPGVDYYYKGVAAYMVCADQPAFLAAQGGPVAKSVWFEAPEAAALDTMVSPSLFTLTIRASGRDRKGRPKMW